MSSSKNVQDTIAEQDATTGDPDSNGSEKSALRWAYMLMCALIVVPITVQWLPSEVALWKQADARNHWSAKERETAFELSSQALEWDANNPTLRTERADWLAEVKRYDEAIAIYASLLDNLTVSGESAFTIAMRIKLCNHLNSRSIHNQQPSEETWQQWEIISAWYQQAERLKRLPLLQQANLHNNRAYQLAVSHSHLDQALASVNLSLESFGGEIYCLYYDPIYYVQDAYQAYSQQDYRAAMESLNKAVDKLGRQYTLLKATLPTITWKVFEKKQLAQRIVNFEILFGNVLLFRASCEKKISREEAGPAVKPSSDGLTDQQLAKELGVDNKYFTPETAHFGNLLLSYSTHTFIPMALDTRGFIYYLQGNLHLALLDLRIAVEATEFDLKQFDEVLKNEVQRIADKDLVKKQRQERAKNLAVMLYHRSLAYDATHQVAKAKKDRERIQQLGFIPSASLH
ncbi:MAG: hypothetical protein CMJ76_01140 [Planctomycetaceae bacterium]|nr:hypothetical protein [Planctomycetaceae bacterium]